MIKQFNDWLAIKITNSVGTMSCAYLFSILAFISFPDALKGGVATTIAWIAQTFLQLVLLSIIMVGQKIDGAAAETRARESHDAIMEALSILRANQAVTHDALGVGSETV